MFSQGVAGRCVDPAPLDPEELGRSLAPFGSSRMLPRAAYLDPEVLAWERQHVFGGWLCVGRSNELPSAPGLKAVTDFDPTSHSLFEIPVADWHGWVFVDPSGAAGDFASHIGALESI